jgi:hypothetical protein
MQGHASAGLKKIKYQTHEQQAALHVKSFTSEY